MKILTLKDCLDKSHFIISVQIDPPIKTDIKQITNLAKDLKEIGISFVDINSSRRVSHDSIQLAGILHKMGFETIPHVTTRDSSLNGLVNQMLTAYSWHAVHNVLIVTGDPYEESQSIIPSVGVFQTDSIGAINVFDEYLRRQLGMDITIAAAVNQNEPWQSESKRLLAKQSAGANFFMSQPVFSKIQYDRLIDIYRKISDKPLIVGIWPLIYQATMETIKLGKVAGVHIDSDVYYEGIQYKDPIEFQNWGLDQAYNLARYIKRSHQSQGVYIVAPSKRPELLLDFFKQIVCL